MFIQSTRISTQLRRVLFLASCTCFSVSAWAQSILPDTFKLEAEPRNAYYFVKPVFGLLQNRSTFQGDNRFKQPHAADLRNTHYGIRIGYHTNRLEIETGIMNLPVATGYEFLFEPINGLRPGTRFLFTRKVTYRQVPILTRFTIWQPTKRLDIRATAGIAFAWDATGIDMNSNRTIRHTLGDTSRITTTTQQLDHTKSFIMGITGMGLHWQLTRRLNLNLDVRRLFSQNDLVRANAQVSPPGENKKYTVKTQGGANGFNLQLGIQYQFIIRKRNRQF